MRAVILLIALLLPFALPAEDKSVLTLDRGSAYEFTWDAPHGAWVTRVYVTPEPDYRATPIKVSLRSVADGSRTDPRLTGLFQISVIDAGPPLTSFDIVVPGDPAVLPGTYQATLVFGTEKLQQAAAIQMVVPSAVLSGPASLQITRVLYSPFDVDNPKLAVEETSGKSFADVKAWQTEPFAGADVQYGGQILMDRVVVVQDHSAELPYRLDGDFPLGTLTAKIAISSPQSQTPLVVPVQVHTRLTRMALALIIVLGLLLGFLTRMVLKPRIELGEARKRTAEAEAALDESDLRHDEKFRKEIAEVRARLRRAIEAANATVASLSAAIALAETARDKAIASLNDRLKAAETQINAFVDVVSPAWVLPAAFADTLAAAKTAASQAARFLDDSNAGKALTVIESAQTDFRAALVMETQTWCDVSSGLLRTLDQVQMLVEFSRRETYRTQRTALDAAAAAAAVAPATDMAGLKISLGALHRFTTTLPGFVSALAAEVAATFTAMDATIGIIALPNQSLWDDAEQSTKEFVGKLKYLPNNGWAKIKLDPAGLLQQWRKALTSQKPDAVEAIAAAFDAGKYEAAARELDKALAASKLSTTRSDDDSRTLPTRTLGLIGANFREFFDEEDTPPSSTTRVRAPSRKRPEPFPEFVATSLKDLIYAKALQSIISGVALTIVGYLIFADKFVGTSGDLLSAFFWGFTTDVGVDALLTAAKAKQGT